MVRLIGGFVFLLAALFFLFAAWMSQDREFYVDSLKSSKVIHADMKLLGKAANAFKTETGRFPTSDELQEPIDPTALLRLGPQPEKPSRIDWNLSGKISVALPGETCALGEATELSEDALRYHRLCYWRGEWFEEFVPETGEHSIPTTLEDYLASPWQTLAIAMLGFGLLVCAFFFVYVRGPRKVVH